MERVSSILCGRTKMRIIVRTLVFPIATYGSETWTLTKADCCKIQAFELWCWRRMLMIPWTAKSTNASILCQEIGHGSHLLNLIDRQALSYFDQITRRQGNCLEKTILQGKIEGSHGPGRPKARWTDRIKYLVGQPLTEVCRKTEDHQMWHVIMDVTTCQP